MRASPRLPTRSARHLAGAVLLLVALGAFGGCRKYGLGLGAATPFYPGQISQPLPEEAQSCLVQCPTGTTCNRRTATCDPLPVGEKPLLLDLAVDAGTSPRAP